MVLENLASRLLRLGRSTGVAKFLRVNGLCIAGCGCRLIKNDQVGFEFRGDGSPFQAEDLLALQEKRGRSMKRTEKVAAVLRFTATASAWLPVRSPQPVPLNRILCRAMQAFRHADCELRHALRSGQRLAHYRMRHISSAYSASTARSHHPFMAAWFVCGCPPAVPGVWHSVLEASDNECLPGITVRRTE